MNILINRNDNLGDIIYSLQLAPLIKREYPDAKVTFMVRQYAVALFKFTPDIDDTLIWEQITQQSKVKRNAMLKKFDVFINAKACSTSARFAWQANIPIRIGNTHRFYHWLYCNRRVSITRKNSPLHEIALNSQLLSPLLKKQLPSLTEQSKQIRLVSQPDEQLSEYLDAKKINVLCHPASNGNGREWPLKSFIALIQQADQNQFNFIISSSKAEQSYTDEIAKHCTYVQNIAGKTTLEQLINFMGMVDWVIAAGTGPLHIAASLGTKTIGLFPPRHAIDKRRWGPQSDKSINLQLDKTCQQKCESVTCECMAKISPRMVLERLDLL